MTRRLLASMVSSFVFASVLIGCATPYSTPSLNPENAQFPGIRAAWESSPNHDVRVIFVHGMCTHTQTSWITNGWDQDMKSYFHSVSIRANTLPAVEGVKLYGREYHIGRNIISARFLIWSGLTADAKRSLYFDNSPTFTQAPGEFTWTRASLNEELKESLVNDCLSDAVIYAGQRGPAIQAKLEAAICVALDGTWVPGNCEFPRSQTHPNRQILLVTESLGSRIVFDAITALQKHAARQGTEQLAAFDEAVAPITEIFMLANQLPLLALARNTTANELTGTSSAGFGSMEAALQVLGKARARHLKREHASGKRATFGGPITLVEFSDPNDLLSYRIPPSDISIVGADVHIANVIVSNSPTYFWFVENPLPAHTAYANNAAVLRLLLDGYPTNAGATEVSP